MITTCRVLLLIVLMASAVHGQGLPTLTNVSLSGSVTLSGDVYSYSYSVGNSLSSAGSIWVVRLDIAQPSGGTQLSGDGLGTGQGFLDSTAKAVTERSETVPMVPITGEAPPNWICSVAVDGRIVWAAGEQSALIRPSTTVSGYLLRSRGLPGVRDFTAEPFLDEAQLPIDPPIGPEDLVRYDKELAALQQSVRFAGVTVGPTAPPADFRLADFLQTIISYKEQAIQLGWIKDRGIGISLDAKLNAAQASLSRGDNRAATNQLSALLEEVDAQAGKQLSSEAVALLKFNTQYLISRML